MDTAAAVGQKAGLKAIRRAIKTASKAVLMAMALATPLSAMEFCVGKVRVTCVVDGDTFWLEGEKIRLADISDGQNPCSR